MSDAKNPELQQELFTEFTPEPASGGKRPDRLQGLSRPQKPILLNLTIEQILLAGIGLVLICCFAFFMGVLRGKSLAGDTAPASSAPRQLPPSAPIVVQAAPKPSLPAAPAVPSAPVRNVKQTAPVIAPSTQKQIFVADLSKPYTIQLVTYKQKDLAEKETAFFRSKGYYSAIIPNGDYFIVCVGQYATKDEAKKDLKLLSSKYKDCFLRRR